MDPTDPASQTLASQGALLGNHEQILQALVESNRNMAAEAMDLALQVSELTRTLLAYTTSQTKPRKDTFCFDPEQLYDKLDKCRRIVLQCDLVYRQGLCSFDSDITEIHFLMGLLRGRTLVWAEALNSNMNLSVMF